MESRDSVESDGTMKLSLSNTLLGDRRTLDVCPLTQTCPDPPSHWVSVPSILPSHCVFNPPSNHRQFGGSSSIMDWGSALFIWPSASISIQPAHPFQPHVMGVCDPMCCATLKANCCHSAVDIFLYRISLKFPPSPLEQPSCHFGCLNGFISVSRCSR